ncbi:MAG: ThuA domain-containing protein [Phycisphaerae bacterium]
MNETQRITRRGFLRRAATAAAAPYVITSSTLAAAPKKKIVLIGHKPDHPFGTHMYLPWCGLLAKCLRQTPGVQAVVSDRWPEDPAVMEGVSAIAVYSGPGAELLLKGKHAAQCEELLMKKGVGLTAIHWATGIRNKKDTKLADLYLACLGGLFGIASGIKTTDSKVEQVAPDHAICRGWKDYELKDEFYLDLKYAPQAKPLFKVRLQEKDYTVGWAYERGDSGGGRSYGNVLGHFHELFAMEPFRRALVNGILWTAHCEIPRAGAPCEVTAEDMKITRPEKKTK